MFHSVYVGDKNTWDDYGLVPVNKIYFPMASQKTQTATIEGASGSLDLSTYMTGYPIYDNIRGSMEFYLLDAFDAEANGQGYAYPKNYNFYDIFAKIRADLDGKTFQVWLEDDPDWYYEGRINVTTKMGSPRPGVTLSYDFGPYKKARRSQKYVLNGMAPIINRQIIPASVAGSMPATFTFTVTGGPADISFECDSLNIDESGTFQPGTYTQYDWIIYGESSIMVDAATGVSVAINYTPGRL